MLYNHFHVDQALQLISSDERLTQILTPDLLPTDEGEEPVPAAANVDPIIEDAIENNSHVEGALPGAFPDQREYSTTTSLSLGLDNQEAYTKLSTYLHWVASLDAIPVGLDGACLFSSMRRVFDAPKEYTSVHLRRQLVITLCNQKDFFYPIMVESIKGTYGFPRMPEDEYQRMYNQDMLTDQQIQDHNCPGPFSFLGYLKVLLKPDFWGDELCLCFPDRHHSHQCRRIHSHQIQAQTEPSPTPALSCVTVRVSTMYLHVSFLFCYVTEWLKL